MNCVNNHTLIGKLINDPMKKGTPEAGFYCDFTLETIDHYKDRQGNKKESATWHLVRLWGKPMDIALESLKAGDRVCIDGKVKNFQYQDIVGGKHTLSYSTGSVILLNKDL